MNKLNQKKYGFVLGLILPILALFVFYKTNPDSYSSFEQFIKYNYKLDTLDRYLKISILLNIAPFIMANQARYTNFAKGVFYITVIYALGVFSFILY